MFTSDELAEIEAHLAAAAEFQGAADHQDCPTCKARSWWRPNEFVFRCRLCGHILSADAVTPSKEGQDEDHGHA